MNVNGDTSVGDVVLYHPGALTLFRELEIDFVANGRQKLKDALKLTDMTVETVLERLQSHEVTSEWKSAESQMRWSSAPVTELVRHIIEVHHAYLRQELDPLQQQISKLQQLRGHAYPELRLLNSEFEKLRSLLMKHIMHEEYDVFARVLRMGEQWERRTVLWPDLEFCLHELQLDHDATFQFLRIFRILLRDYKVPKDASKAYRDVCGRIESLELNVSVHLHLENHVLFHRLLPDFM